MEKLAKGRWWFLILGILAVIGGIIYLTNPIGTSLFLVKAIGVLFLIAGVLHIVNYFTSKEYVSGFQIVSGILDILVGVLCLMNTASSAIAFMWVIIFWVMFSGILAIGNSFELKSLGHSVWWLELLVGIFGVLFAVILLSGGVVLQAAYVSIFISVYLFIIGIDMIALFFSINSATKQLRQ